MGRRGMVTIGVAVQAETFSNSNNSSPLPPNLENIPTYSSSKSAIFLPPSKDGTPQTLRITFSYNPETKLPEIIVNFEGEDQERRYMELKELCRGDVSNMVTEVSEEEESKDSGKETAETESSEKGKEVQVYYFNEIKRDSSKTTNTSPMKDCDRDLNQKADSSLASGSPKFMTELPKSVNSKGVESSDSISEESSRKGSRDEGQKGKKQKSKGQGVRGKMTSPEKRSLSPTKDRSSRIPVIQSSAAGHGHGLTACEYYRQKFLQEHGCTDFSSTCWSPTHYNFIQKTAGQKVVNKMAAQQKILEEQAAAQRKRTEFVFHDDLGFYEAPDKLFLRKKVTKLDPLPKASKCH